MHSSDTVKARCKALGLGKLDLIGRGKDFAHLAKLLAPDETLNAVVTANVGGGGRGLLVTTSSRVLTANGSPTPPVSAALALTDITAVVLEPSTLGLRPIRIVAGEQSILAQGVADAEADRFAALLRQIIGSVGAAQDNRSAPAQAITDCLVGFGNEVGEAAVVLPSRLAALLKGPDGSVSIPRLVVAKMEMQLHEDDSPRGGIGVLTDDALLLFGAGLADPKATVPEASLLRLSLADTWFVDDPSELRTPMGSRCGATFMQHDGEPGLVAAADSKAARQLLEMMQAIVHAGAPPGATIESMQPDGVIARIRLSPCHYLGGHGFGLDAGFGVSLDFITDGANIRRLEDGTLLRVVPYSDVTGLQVGGPGTTQSGGQWGGGGFGIGGIVTGIAAAALLNTLTTRTRTDTLIKLVTPNAEGTFHFGEAEPEELELLLSPVFVRLRQLATEHQTAPKPVSSDAEDDPIARLERLAALRQAGHLDDREFAALKSKLIGSL